MRLVALLLSAAIAACGPAAGPGPVAPAATTAPAKAVWPLRGTEAPERDAVQRRPIVVPIGNEEARGRRRASRRPTW